MALTSNFNNGDTRFRPSKVLLALAVFAMLFLGINDAMAKGGLAFLGINDAMAKGHSGGGGGDPPPPPSPPPDETIMATFKLCTGSRNGESGRSIEVTENGKTIIKRIRCD